MKPPLVNGLLIFQGSLYLIMYHLFEKALHSMSQGLLMENVPHWMREHPFALIFQSHTSEKGQINEYSRLIKWRPHSMNHPFLG